MPIWVVIKNVPHSMYSWKGLGFLASAVGEPKRLHPDTELCKNFEEPKVFVEVDLSKDLPKTYNFNLKDEEVTIAFTYPWLPHLWKMGTSCRRLPRQFKTNHHSAEASPEFNTKQSHQDKLCG